MKAKTLILSAIAVFATASISSADLVNISSVLYTGSQAERTGGFGTESQIIDGSGLSGTVASEADFATVTHAQIGPTNAWESTDPGAAGGDFFDPAQGAGTVVFEFTLGGLDDIDTIAIWDYEFGGNSLAHLASNITLDFSNDGGTTFQGSETVPIPVAGAVGAATTASFASQNADFIRLTVNDNHFGTLAFGGPRVGFSEVRFANTAVPEPSSLVVLGLGAVGLLFRRRSI